MLLPGTLRPRYRSPHALLSVAGALFLLVLSPDAQSAAGPDLAVT